MSNNSIFSNSTNPGTTPGASNTLSDVIQLPFFSLTIVLSIFFSSLILIRPIFRKNKLNWFAVNICVTSILFSLTMLSTNVQRILNISDSSPCRLRGFLIDMSVCQLMYSHCTAAISRVLAIIYANRYFFRSTRCTVVCLALGWFVGIVAASPYLFVDGFACGNEAAARILSYYTLFGTLALPIGINAICNCRILLFVRKSSRQVQSNAGGRRASHSRDVQLVKTLVGTFVVFVAGWIPVFLVQAFPDSIQLSDGGTFFIQILPSIVITHDVCLIIFTNQPVRVFLFSFILRRHRNVEQKAAHTIKIQQIK